jgi:hypothetical protein
VKKGLVLLMTGLFGVGMLAGCTANGKGFDDPKGEISVVGEPFIGCDGGSAFIFGTARNTGDLEARNITAIADVFGGGGEFLGRFQAQVSAGVETLTVEGEEETVEVPVIIDTLEVDQEGTFTLYTTVGCGRIAREEYSFDFTTATFEEF